MRDGLREELQQLGVARRSDVRLVGKGRNSLLKKPSGLSACTNSALADTWTVKMAVEGQFDAVRLWLPNPRTDSAISFDAIAVASTENVQAGVTGAGEWQPQVAGSAVTTLDATADYTGWQSAPIVKTSGNYALTATGATKAYPCVVSTADTSTAKVGDTVTCSAFVGMTELNGNTYKVVAVVANTSISLDVNSTGFTTYSSAGTVTSYAERSGSVVAATNPVRPAWGVTDWVTLGSADGAEGSAWQANHAYVVGNRINDGTYAYECTTAGTSGSTIPALLSTIGGTVTDGATLVWRNMGPKFLRYILVRIKTVTAAVYQSTEGTRNMALSDTVNRGRIFSTARATGADYATTPSSGTAFATGVNGPYIPFVLEYRCRKRGLSVMYVADSLGAYAYGHPTDSPAGSSDYLCSPGMRAAAIASTESVPVETFNASFAAKSSKEYQQIALDAFTAGMRPNVVLVHPFTPNDIQTNAGIARLTRRKELARLEQLCDTAQTYGAVVVAIAPQPHQGTAAGVDAERQWLAARLGEMQTQGRLFLCDIRTAMTTAASLGTSQENWIAAYTWDAAMHWSDAGVEVAAAAEATALGQVAVRL